jgi:hypothetical protein
MTRARRLGEKILIDFGEVEGQSYWRERGRSEIHAVRHQARSFGADCSIEEGGQWDPVWDRTR